MLPACISFSVALTCMLPQEVLKRKLYFVFKLMLKLFSGFFFCLFVFSSLGLCSGLPTYYSVAYDVDFSSFRIFTSRSQQIIYNNSYLCHDWRTVG